LVFGEVSELTGLRTCDTEPASVLAALGSWAFVFEQQAPIT